MSGSYEILKDTWIYDNIKQEVQEEIQQQQLIEQRRILLEIIHARFPRIEALAKQVVEGITKAEVLRELTVRVGIARTEKEARQSINNIGHIQVVESG